MSKLNTAGEEYIQEIKSRKSRDDTGYYYLFIAANGTDFRTQAKTVQTCRRKRDRWLKRISPGGTGFPRVGKSRRSTARKAPLPDRRRDI